MTSEEKYLKFTTENVCKLIATLAVPTVATMLVTAFYNMADAFFVGKISASASGAVSVVFSFMTVIQAIGYLFGHGSGNYMSRSLGRQQADEAEKMAITGFCSSFIFGAILAVAGNIFIEPLAVALGSTETIKPHAVAYLRFILIGAPFMTSALTLNNQLRFQGSALYGMIAMVTGGVINVGLDALFVYELSLGTAGAGLATAISQTISFVLLIIGTFFGGNVRLCFKKFQLKGFYYAEILRGGLPSLARQAVAGVSTVCINFACAAVAGEFADEAIAALGIVAKITGFFTSAVIGFGQGFQPVCGFNYGAGRYDRVLKGFYFSVAVTTAFALAASAVCIPFAKSIVRLFTDSAQVEEYAKVALRAGMILFGLSGTITISNMFLQNIGKVVPATVLSLARQGLFLIPTVFIAGNALGVFGLEISQAISDALSFLLCVPLTLPTILKLSGGNKTK